MSQIYWYEKDRARRGCSCLFLDRDGVIVEEVNYLHRREDVRILPGSRELIKAAQDHGWAIGLITNQAGIGRGYYDWSAFSAVQEEIVAQLDAGPTPFDFVAACASHPEAANPFHRVENHSWRKPNTGMLQMAAKALELDIEASALIGDQLSDIRAAVSAQLGHVFHIGTGHGHEQRADVRAFLKDQAISATFVETLFEVQTQFGWQS
jgi:D-glycero-D-manno-heptose 1,7-bisphosphate phosphatase